MAGVPHPGVDHLQVPDVVLDQLHHLVHSVAVTGDPPLRPPVPGQPEEGQETQDKYNQILM